MFGMFSKARHVFRMPCMLMYSSVYNYAVDVNT